MKKIKYLLFLILILLPIKINALEVNYEINKFDVNGDILENGDVLVTEKITMTGNFNGYIRDIKYKSAQPLYDPSKIELIKICNEDLVNCYNQVGSANNGASMVYTVLDNGNTLSLKMYNYTPGGTKTFAIQYLLKDVVLVHNDIAELYYNFIGNSMDDDIYYASITINLPKEDANARVWAHGPLNGNVDLLNNKTLSATISSLYRNNPVDIRFVFDKTIVPNAIKLTNSNGLDNILADEKVKADEASQQREKARLINTIFDISIYVWLAGAVALIVYVYLKYDREYNSEFKSLYMRDLPSDYEPGVVEYLMKAQVTDFSLSASILNIIRKGKIKVTEESTGNAKDYVLVPSDIEPKYPLTASEEYVYKWMIFEIGGGRLSISNLKKLSFTPIEAETFMDSYKTWKEMVRDKAILEEFFEKATKIKIIGVIYGILGFGIFFYASTLGFSDPFYLITFLFLLSIITILYMIAFRKKSKKGIEQYTKWKAFKRFLLHFGRFSEKELPEIILWEQFLVYATVFGIADKVAKVMKIKLDQMGVTQPQLLIFTHNHFGHQLSRALSSAKTASMSEIASSRNSSGGGFGGGFSSGGGFGGGGGGGRGF